MLVHLRKGETFTQLATGFGISATTAWRYVQETMALMSARSPKLQATLRKAERDQQLYLVLDGTPIRTDRPYYSGKHRTHEMNVQVITSADGPVIWTSGPCPAASTT